MTKEYVWVLSNVSENDESYIVGIFRSKDAAEFEHTRLAKDLAKRKIMDTWYDVARYQLR